MSPKNKKGKKLTSTIMALAMTVTTTFQMPLFAGYIPDMFARDQEDLALGYRRLFPEEETKRKKENRKKKSAHKRTRRAL